jgi:hypothetical protein
MATGIGSGLSTQFGIETETTIGTPVAVTRFLEVDSETLMADHTIAQGQGLRGNLYRRDARRVLVARHAKGDVPFDLPTNGMGKILQHCLGSFSTTATVVSGAAYQQIHNTGSVQGKTFTAQKGIADTTGYIHPYTYPGCKVTSWEVSAQPGAMVKFKMSIDAVDEVTESQAVTPTTLAAAASAGATSISTVASIPSGTYINVGTDSLTEYVTTGTPTGAGPYTIPITGSGTANGLKYAHASGAVVGNSPNVYNSLTKLQTASYSATTSMFSFKDAHFVIGGTTSQVSGVWTNTGGLACTPANGIVIKNIDLKGTNALKVDRYGAGVQTVAEQLENGFRDITGSMDIEYNNRWFYDAYQVDQALTLVMTFQNLDAPIGATGRYPTVQFYLPAITFEDGASLQAPGPDVITQKLSFTALDDGTNGTLQAYVVSTDTSV